MVRGSALAGDADSAAADFAATAISAAAADAAAAAGSAAATDSAAATSFVTAADFAATADSAADTAADSSEAPGPVVASTAPACNSDGVVRGSASSGDANNHTQNLSKKLNLNLPRVQNTW